VTQSNLDLEIRMWFFEPAEADTLFAACLSEIAWQRTGKPRSECWMSPAGEYYYYGKVSERYDPHPYAPCVAQVAERIVETFGDQDFNCCFANRYDTERDNLGWHADDSVGMSHDHPIYVVSFGEPRQLHVRESTSDKVAHWVEMTHGSVLRMPPGMQRTHMHRVAKSSRKATRPRVSLTFRTLRLGPGDREALAEAHARSQAEHTRKSKGA